MAPGVEFGDLNYIGMGLAILSNVIIGMVWYSPKVPTGRIWVKTTGMDPNAKMNGKAMAMSMGLMLIGVILTMFILAHSFIAYRDAYRLDQAGYDLTLMDGLMGGFFTWLGFFLPVQLNGVAFDKKPWGLTMVNAGYYLVALLVAGIMLAVV